MHDDTSIKVSIKLYNFSKLHSLVGMMKATLLVITTTLLVAVSPAPVENDLSNNDDAKVSITHWLYFIIQS